MLILAALSVRTLQAVEAIELCFDPDQVVVVRIDPRSGGYTPEDLTSLYERFLARVRALPGVMNASLSAGGPFGGSIAPKREGGLASHAKVVHRSPKAKVDAVTPGGERAGGICVCVRRSPVPDPRSPTLIPSATSRPR